MKKRRNIFASLLIITVLGAITVYIYVFHKPHRKVESETAVKVAAVDLFKSYIEDEKKANSLYLDKALEVTGEVEEVKANQENKTMVVCKTEDPIFGVVCTFRENVPNLSKGATVVIKGLCSGYDGNDVKLRDCILINSK